MPSELSPVKSMRSRPRVAGSCAISPARSAPGVVQHRLEVRVLLEPALELREVLGASPRRACGSIR
jgi:hypothetical protein